MIWYANQSVVHKMHCDIPPAAPLGVHAHDSGIRGARRGGGSLTRLQNRLATRPGQQLASNDGGEVAK